MKHLFALVLIAPLGACAAEVASVSSPLLGAPVDPDHEFAVGVCGGTPLADGSCPRRGTPGVSRCTGTLVAPNLVLTARHCIHAIDFTSADFCANTFTETTLSALYRVTAAPSIQTADAEWSDVEQVVVPEGDSICDDDIAFLVLSDRIRGVRPALIDPFRDVARRPPSEVAIVARGNVAEQYDLTTFARIVSDDGGFTRRIAEHVPFVCASNEDDDCVVTDFFSPPSNTYALNASGFAFGAAGAAGDSGAGVYDQRLFSHGIYLVIGVANTVTIGEDGIPNSTQAVRLDRHRETIGRAFLAAHDARHGS